MKLRSRLADVAKYAGVSTATVSAVINHTVGGNIRVSPETRQRVLEAVAKLGYVANPAARSLAGGMNRILGIFTYQPIFPFQHHDFFYPFLLGIEEEAQTLGYHLLIFTNVTDASGKRSIYHDDTNLLYMADGSIMLGVDENKTELYRLREEDYPFVYVGRREVTGVEISYTAADYISATAQLVAMLARMGHRNITFIGLREQRESLEDRLAGFNQGCRENDLTPSPDMICEVSPGEITPDWVRSLVTSGVTAALVQYDNQAQALFKSLNALGLSIPKDFSVVLLGDPHYAWDNTPDWTMFTMPRREMGIEAVRLLVQQLEHPQDARPSSVLLPCRIIPGQTIAPPRAL